jgi:hypothetical protein
MVQIEWEYTSGSIPTWRRGNVTIAQMRDSTTCRDDAYHVYWNGKKLFVCLNDFEHAVTRLANYAKAIRESK